MSANGRNGGFKLLVGILAALVIGGLGFVSLQAVTSIDSEKAVEIVMDKVPQHPVLMQMQEDLIEIKVVQGQNSIKLDTIIKQLEEQDE